jgi:hypothetical protein
MASNTEAYNEICCDTLSRGGGEFIHQHVVDAFAAQDASPGDQPIRLAFALVGLYLHNEHGFTGREVQLAHMQLARNKQPWPTFELPIDRGRIDALAVLAAPADQRDQMIHDWTASVWKAFADQRDKIEQLLQSNGIPSRRSVTPPRSGRSRDG